MCRHMSDITRTLGAKRLSDGHMVQCSLLIAPIRSTMDRNSGKRTLGKM